MPKKVALITAFTSVAQVHQRTLKALFKAAFELECHSFDTGVIRGPITADLVIVSIYQIYANVRQYLPGNAKVVIISNTITEEQYQRVAELSPGRPVLLVNYSVEMTMDTISLFHQLGLNHLEFVPYYPGVTNAPQLEIAVTPGESAHVPPFVKHLVDIGNRVMDAKTIVDIAHGLGLDHLLNEAPFLSYFQTIRMSPDSVTTLFDRTNILEGQISSLLDVMDDGIVIIENSGRVLSCNSKAREVLGNPGEIVGRCVADLIPGITFDEVLKSSRAVDYTLVKIQSRNVSVKVAPVLVGGTKKGALAILSQFDERERSQHRLRSQLLGKGHRARYTFDNIQTKDEAFQEVKNLARKKAKSEASVLIIGETGTGKELFAHAIHNSSQRKAWPFVAINCAALPESLLESELFGYEEGAFTGARRGGKPGLFELAHKGTIFLDEIGEMNLSLQARLLRVLENREVMRIGGDTMINVDIRVIAATNKELWQLVEEGCFRKDLYYRLNVLPIQIPPLRERPSDILFILEHMLHAMGVCLTLEEAVAGLIQAYPWPGNVRELKNVAEYLAYLDKDTIEAKDLMPVLRWPASARPVGSKVTAAILETFGPDQAHCRFLLERLHAGHKQKIRMGRRTLCQQAMERDMFLTEAQIRKLLVQLEAQGLVRMSNGRGGTVISPSGIEFLKQIANA